MRDVRESKIVKGYSLTWFPRGRLTLPVSRFLAYRIAKEHTHILPKGGDFRHVGRSTLVADHLRVIVGDEDAHQLKLIIEP